MDQVALLAELRALADQIPDFDTFTPTSRTHQAWLGKVHALVELWDRYEGAALRTQVSLIAVDIGRKMGVAGTLTILHRAIADLEFRLPVGAEQVFGPGAVYDFFKALRELLASATRSIFIVDSFLDEQIFDTYLTAAAMPVTVRLLVREGAAALGPAVAKFIAQTKMTVEIRRSEALHDRVIFLDDRSCWVLGQSVKDAAKSKTTYLAPLDSDAAGLKKAVYEQLWANSKPI